MTENKQPGSQQPDMDYGDGFYVSDARKNAITRSRTPKPQQMPVKKKKKSGCFGKLISFLLIAIAIILIITGIYLISVLSRINYTGENPDHSISENDGIILRDDSNINNILLFGEDNHKENEHGRADTMILLTIDKKHNQLKQTSFMRDIYLYIPGQGYNKLNAAYVFGGPKLAAETIEYNFGIKIDNYLIVDFNSFTDIVDSLGGIDLELTYDEIEYINMQSLRNHQTDKEKELDPDSYTYYTNAKDETVAKVHLIGRQALWYARDRDSAGSDFDRTNRQRTVINTILNKFKSSNPITLMSAIYSASPYISTNMSSSGLFGNGFEIFLALNYERFEHRIPSMDNYYDVWNESGLALQIADTELENQRLYDFVFGDASSEKE